MSDKWWNLEDGKEEGYSRVPHTLICLLMDSKALTLKEINVLACLVRQTWGIQGRKSVEASAQQIATATNLHFKVVQEALRSLEKKGHVTVEREKGGASAYRLNFESIRPAGEERKRGRRNKAAYDPNHRPQIEEVTQSPEFVEEQKRRIREVLGNENPPQRGAKILF